MKTKSVIHRLKYLFYIVIVLQVIILVSFAFRWISLMPDVSNISVVLERYALLITLISIPGALKLFSIIMKGNKHPESEVQTTMLYIKAFTARFGILFLVASINILLFALSFNRNFLLCTLVIFTAYIFTYPSSNYFKANKEPNN